MSPLRALPLLVVLGCSTAPASVDLPHIEASPVVVHRTPSPEPRSRIGQPVRLPNIEWIIVEARDLGQQITSNTEFNKTMVIVPGRFVAVHFTVKNLSPREQITPETKIVDAQDREFRHIDLELFYLPDGGHSAYLDTVNAGKEKPFWTVIELPADAKELRFRVGTFDSPERRFVELGL